MAPEFSSFRQRPGVGLPCRNLSEFTRSPGESNTGHWRTTPASEISPCRRHCKLTLEDSINISTAMTTKENYYSKFKPEVNIKLEAHY